MLEGESIFIETLVKILKEGEKKFSVYWNVIDNRSMDPNDNVDFAKKAKFGVFICSPRFNSRYQERSPELMEEIDAFKSRGTKCIIPIIFGTEIKDFNTNSPFHSRNFNIKIPYEDFRKGKITVEDLVNIAYKKILYFIESVNLSPSSTI